MFDPFAREPSERKQGCPSRAKTPLIGSSTEKTMSELNVQAFIDAGAHIGCRVSRWNPKMAPFILETRNGVHVIDLRETIRGILRGKHFLREVIATGQDVLFVGTKPQIAAVIEKVNTDTGQPYVDDRWIGGTLTNYEVIGSRIAYLEELEKKESEGYLDKLSKKEGSRFLREKRKTFRNLHGIRDMFRLPGAMVVIDPKTERNAVREAQRMGIPVVGVVDTDCDPDVCDLLIPANDDAIRSVSLVLEHLVEAVREGKVLRKERGVAEPERQAGPATGKGVPMPKPRGGGRRRPDRRALENASRQVEIQAIPGGGVAPDGDAPDGDAAPADAPAVTAAPAPTEAPAAAPAPADAPAATEAPAPAAPETDKPSE